jgi:hypothetical protein
MNKNETQNISFFSDIQGFFWKMIAGLVSFAVVVPFFIEQSGDHFGIPAKPSFSLILMLYFLSPVIGFGVWFRVREADGFKESLKLHPKIVWYYYSWVAYAIVAASMFWCPFSCCFTLLFYAFSLIFILSVCIYTVWTIWHFRLYNKINAESGDRKNSSVVFRKQRKQITAEYFSLLAVLLVIAIPYFWHAFAKCENFAREYNSKEKYDLGFSMRDLNAKHIRPLEKLMQEKYNELILANSMASLLPSNSLPNTTEVVPGIFRSHFRNLYANMDNLTFSMKFADSAKMQITAIQHEIGKINITGAGLNDLQRFEHLMNMTKAVRQKADKIYSESWTALLKAVQLSGLLLFFIVIMFLLAAWFHASLTNITEQHHAAISREKDTVKADPGQHPAGKEEDDKEKYVFPEIRAFKNLIGIVILLIIPIFKTVKQEDVRLDKPLWQFNVNNLVQGQTKPVTPVPQDQDKPTPGTKTLTLGEIETLLRVELEKHEESINSKTESSIKNSTNTLFQDLKGK